MTPNELGVSSQAREEWSVIPCFLTRREQTLECGTSVPPWLAAEPPSFDREFAGKERQRWLQHMGRRHSKGSGPSLAGDTRSTGDTRSS